jgi:hypothetical protein
MVVRLRISISFLPRSSLLLREHVQGVEAEGHGQWRGRIEIVHILEILIEFNHSLKNLY